MTYTVTLKNLQADVPDSVRQEAERRYRSALEDRLGSAENVPHHLRAYIKAGESEVEELSRSEALAAVAYMVAQHHATLEGSRGLDRPEEAHFEVRLDGASRTRS